MFSLKGLLLLAMSAIFSFALYTFHQMNEGLRYTPADIEELKALTEMGAYAEEFQIMEANRLARPSREDNPPQPDVETEQDDQSL